jgi:putative acetyltransferase
MIVRPETPGDINDIEEVTFAAFTGKPYADGTEHVIINRLREAQALVLSLVAETEGRVVGHVAFSKVTINGVDRGWYGLGPISVHPDIQKLGIGSLLIHEGLARLRAMGANGCVLEGDPNYYGRFGFKSHPNLIYEKSPAPQYFMALPFFENLPSGSVEFHPAFYTHP